MPGIHTFIGIDQQIDLKKIEFLMHETWYKLDQIMSHEKITMCISYYYGYPFFVLDNEDFVITCEGMIYNLEDEKLYEKLNQIGKKLAQQDNIQDDIREFVNLCDGDFIVQIYDKRNYRYLVFNDYLGRLPLYYSIESNRIIISREIKTHLEFNAKISLDYCGISEYLMLGYALGHKTIFYNIQRLNPGEILLIKDIRDLNTIQYFTSVKISYHRTNKTYNKCKVINDLVDCYLNSTKTRINKLREKGYFIISDLSGGFDTRALIGGLAKFDKKVQYFTYEYIQDESAEAKSLFDELNKPGEYIKLSYNEKFITTINDLVYRTDGQGNYYTTDICYNDSLCLQNNLGQKYKIAHFGGLGGEFMRHPEKRFIKSLYYGFLAGIYTGTGLNTTKSLLNITKSVEDEIKKYFQNNYNGNKEEQLRRFYYEYYLFYVGYAGEDRGRIFNWTVQPIWSKDLINAIFTQVPLKETGYKFFIEFMKQIDERLLNVAIFNKDFDINSNKSIDAFEKRYKDTFGPKFTGYNYIKYKFPGIIASYRWLKNKKVASSDKDLDVYNNFLKSYNKLSKFKSIFILDRVKEHIHLFGGRFDRFKTLAIYLNQIEIRYPDKIDSNITHV